MQDLDLDHVPPPQLTEHPAQELQVDQPPWTERRVNIVGFRTRSQAIMGSISTTTAIGNLLSIKCEWLLYVHFYRPPTKSREGNVFIRAYLSTREGVPPCDHYP